MLAKTIIVVVTVFECESAYSNTGDYIMTR